MSPHAVSHPRRRAALRWGASCGMPTYAACAGVRFDQTFYDFDAICEAYDTGRPLAEKRFGPDVGYAGPNFSAISYGHVNCLGAPLRFVDGGEVGHTPFCESLADAIDAVTRPIDWRTAGQMPYYLNLCERLKQHYGADHVSFAGFKDEGPITTAWCMRGQEFFTDVYDDPDGVRELLDAVVDSIISYRAFLDSVTGKPRPARIGVADDVAAMLSPDVWRRIVVPVLDRFYTLQHAEHRYAHIEDLTPAHLPLLDDVGLDSFDPSVSPRLTAADLETKCQAAFHWRFNAMQCRALSPGDIRAYVDEGVRHGASLLMCYIEPCMLDDHMAANVHAFMDAAKAACEAENG